MLYEFKKFIVALEYVHDPDGGGPASFTSELTAEAYRALVELTRSIYGNTAAHVIEIGFCETEEGTWIVSTANLVEVFSDSIKGPT